MSITPLPPPVNVGTPDLRPDPRPHCIHGPDCRFCPEPGSVEDKARDAICASQFNRDLHALVNLAEQMEDALQAFWDAHDSSSLPLELVRAGVLEPEEVNGPVGEKAADLAERVCADVYGYLWATQMFRSIAVSNLHSLPDDEVTPVAALAARAERPLPPDVTPCAVVGGRDGA